MYCLAVSVDELFVLGVGMIEEANRDENEE